MDEADLREAELLAKRAEEVMAMAADAAQGAALRFDTDFEQLAVLGRGTFGEVVLAQNKVDGRKYALKKIPLSMDSKDREKILREASVLSGLVHRNVIRYYGAWIETGTDTRKKQKDQEGLDDDEDDEEDDGEDDEDGGGAGVDGEEESTKAKQPMSKKAKHDWENKKEQALPAGLCTGYEPSFSSSCSGSFSGSSDGVVRLSSSSEEGSSSGSSSGGSSSSSEDGSSSGGSSHGGGSTRHSTFSPSSNGSKATSPATPDRGENRRERLYLYIQMEHCACTMKDQMELGKGGSESHQKLLRDPYTLWDYFGQLISGLCYIHSKRIVHRCGLYQCK
jgi:translation initiation factor 2-alpha kinase 4